MGNQNIPGFAVPIAIGIGDTGAALSGRTRKRKR